MKYIYIYTHNFLHCYSVERSLREQEKKKQKQGRTLLSRSDIPEETKNVPLGPHLTPGIWDEDTLSTLRVKLLVRVLVAAISVSQVNSLSH